MIRSDPDVRDVQVDGNRVMIEFADPAYNSAELLKKLVAKDVEVFSYAEKEPSLEDVFMKVTKGLVS